MSREKAIELLTKVDRYFQNPLNLRRRAGQNGYAQRMLKQAIELLESEPESRCKRCDGTGKIWVEIGAMCADAEIKCPDCKKKSEKEE